MKVLIATLTLLSCFASQASQLPIVRSAQLPERQLDVNHFGFMTVSNAMISVDHSNRIVRLKVSGFSNVTTMHCDVASLSCRQQPIEQTVDLKMKSDVQTRCSRTITAEEDHRPVDGLKQT